LLHKAKTFINQCFEPYLKLLDFKQIW